MILAHQVAYSQNLTQSARTKWIQAGFAHHDLGRLPKNTTNFQAWKWETGSRPVVFCQKPATMIPAHQLASRPDAFVWPNPDQAMLIGSGLVLHNMIHAFGKMEPNRMREVGSDIYMTHSQNLNSANGLMFAHAKSKPTIMLCISSLFYCVVHSVKKYIW